jgi:hypothetical protein
MKKYIVELTVEQREELSHMISTGKASARELTHARILLKADQGPHSPNWRVLSELRTREQRAGPQSRHPLGYEAIRIMNCRAASLS